MASNKNTIYTRSLVNFLLDTKPYSRKLTEINEIYKLHETINVAISDDLFTGITSKSVWPYSFFSNGNSSQPLNFKRISNYRDYGKFVNNQPSYSRGAFKIGRDASASLGLVPNTYDPKSLAGIGLKDCYIQQNGDPINVQYFIEGIDVFLSKGSYSFQIKQINGSNVSGTFIKTYDDTDGPFPIDIEIDFSYDEIVLSGPVTQIDETTFRVVSAGEVRIYGTVIGGIYNPLIKELKQEGLIAAARQASAELAYDSTVSYSAISQVTFILNAIQDQLNITPSINAQRELDALFEILDIPKLPYSYEDLIGQLISDDITVIDGYLTWGDVSKKLETLSPRILFNDFTDFNIRESGKLYYSDLITSKINIFNIAANPNKENYEEYTLTALNNSELLVSGNLSDAIGIATIGFRFESPAISFDISAGDVLLIAGDIFTLTPASKITVSQNTVTQSWSIIKTNPIAYSRPIYTSPTNAYAKIVSLDNREGFITFLDNDFPSGKIELEVISASQLRMKCEAEPDYLPIVTIGQIFNDGRLGFIVINGSFAPLQIGDRIIMDVFNSAPQVQDLGLYYGYDTDAYDANNLVYNNVTSAIENYLTTLDFGYDSRFLGYDISTFNLVVTDSAVSNRKWRLRALADLSKPLLMPSRIVNLLGADDPTNPSALAKYDSDNNVTSEGIQSSTDIDELDDLQLWYADRFALEYQDGEAGVWQIVNSNIQIGQRYTFADHGIAFTVVAAAKPFIASRSTSTTYVNTIGGSVTTITDGGDIIQFGIINPDPVLRSPASVISGTPRLIMYGEHFYKCPSASWTITKIASGFTLQGKYTSNNLNVYTTPLILSATDGLSYHIKEYNLHFTIIEGRGIAIGDTFTFTTYADAPAFLVHGSTTGWTQPARLNEWYWNGHIGFKIKPAECDLFIDGDLQSGTNSWNTTFGLVEVEYLREDLNDCIIRITSQENGIWLAYKDGTFISSSADVIDSAFIRVSLPPVSSTDAELIIKVKGITHDFSLGKDLVILNASSERFPKDDDFLVIERIETDDIQLAIKPLNADHNNDLRNLGAQTIDVRFTGSTSSLTSPELNVLSNWIPLTIKFKGPSGNEVAFGSVATEVELTSPITLEKIADIRSLGSKLNEDVYAFWDTDFYENYLPLNSESILLAKSSGFNERVHVNMSESVTMLTSASGLSESSLFSDVAAVSIEDIAQIMIGITHADIVTVETADGPFIGFVPGFDNLPYDFETLIGNLNDLNGGYYDAGLPLVGSFERAKQLAALGTLTPQEQLELNNLLGTLNAYLVNGNLNQTNIAQFISAINSDDSVNFAPTNYGFGYPAVGLGMHVKESAGASASSSIVDTITILTGAPGTLYDARNYDIGLYDEKRTAGWLTTVAKSATFDALPTVSTFEDYASDLYVTSNIDNVILKFDQEVFGYPEIYVWENSWSKPALSNYDKNSTKELNVFVPSADEIKLSILSTPRELFLTDDFGVWIDGSDARTLFQDAAGSTIVSNVNQTIQFVLDKSKEANRTNGIQVNASLAPVFVLVQTVKFLVFPVNGSLVITFPGSLGTGCTIAYSRLNEDPVILSNQTVGSSFNIDFDFINFMIIDRVLTTSEQAYLYYYLNRNNRTTLPTYTAYLDIQDSAAIPDDFFYTHNSINSGNNSGWNFI